MFTDAISFKVGRVISPHLDLGKKGQDTTQQREPKCPLLQSTHQAEQGGEHDPDSWFV